MYPVEGCASNPKSGAKGCIIQLNRSSIPCLLRDFLRDNIPWLLRYNIRDIKKPAGERSKPAGCTGIGRKELRPTP